MIEIEFSALARLCLHRRNATMEKLESELMAIIQLKQGKTGDEVVQSLYRSPSWVAKWYKRSKEKR